MKFRKANQSDLKQMMTIVTHAQKDLKAMNVDQWQNGYPNETVLTEDILKEKAYVLDGDGMIAALMVCSMNDESTYDPLKTWKANEYLVIHRFAVHKLLQRQGIASLMIEHAKQLAVKNCIFSLRIDTHEKNVRMRRFLEKNHFEERGIIYLKDGNPRVAYELLL